MGLDHLHCVRFDFVCKYFPGLFSWAHLLPLLARFIYRPTQQQKPHVLLDTCFYYVLFTWASRKSFQTLTLLWRNRLEASRKYKYLFNLKMAIFVFFPTHLNKNYAIKSQFCVETKVLLHKKKFMSALKKIKQVGWAQFDPNMQVTSKLSQLCKICQ